MRPVGFEPTVSAGERPQIYALDRAITVISLIWNTAVQKYEGRVAFGAKF
jgi:hypothetical protein